MVKILLGLVAAIVIAAGGFFGFQFYTQHRIAGEIDTTFEQIRADGGKASHGAVSFDLLKRTVTIVDIAAETAAQPPVSLKIANVTASGVGQPDATHFSADSIDVSGLEFGTGTDAAGSWRISYKAPQISLKAYSGPLRAETPASSSAIDFYRAVLEQIARVSASSITVQDLAGTLNFGTVAAGGSGDFAYSNLAMEDIKDGKIKSVKADGVNFTFATQAAGRSDKLTGNLANPASYDIDMTALAAILNPQKADNDQYYRIYRQASTGAYRFTSAQGVRAGIDGITVEDVGVRPSRFDILAILSMMPAPGTVPTPAQTREMMGKVAGLYEGIHIGNTEMRGLSMETPQGPIKFSTIRYNLDNGKGDFAIEGLEARTPNGPFQLGRLALKSFDIAGLMRISAQFTTPGQPPSPDQALAFLRLLEGAEVKGLSAPFKTTNKQVTIDTVSLNWGQFVGSIPTQAHLVAKMVTPIDASDPTQQPLLAAGLDKLAIDADLGAGWTEASGTFALAPATIDIGNLLKASVRASLAKVPRGVFAPNLAQAMSVAGQVETAPLELTLHDAGAIDLMVAQYARTQNLSREAARAAIINAIKTNGAKVAAANADGAAAVAAVTRFVETPGQTLIIKLTPIANIPALKLVELLKVDPLTALAQFRIEASTGL